jgi:hypothetical protein
VNFNLILNSDSSSKRKAAKKVKQHVLRGQSLISYCSSSRLQRAKSIAARVHIGIKYFEACGWFKIFNEKSIPMNDRCLVNGLKTDKMTSTRDYARLSNAFSIVLFKRTGIFITIDFLK